MPTSPSSTSPCPPPAHDLGLSELGRQWVVTASALAYGSLLLLGGRMAQPIGYRRALGAGPDTAVAGALGSTVVQVGAGIGTAWLTTLAAAAAASYGREHPGASGRDAVAHGYTSTGLVTATTLGVAAIAVWFLVGSRRTGDARAGGDRTGSGSTGRESASGRPDASAAGR